jgi:hypothetical protein
MVIMRLYGLGASGEYTEIWRWIERKRERAREGDGKREDIAGVSSRACRIRR